jgi:assimilatory nitrate reductase catalytic subunit
LATLDDADYEDMEPYRWGGARFAFAPREARLVSVAQQPPDEAAMVLNTGRYRDQWHSMTRTGLSPRLSQHRREALVEIHPADAAAANLVDGDLARIVTAQGSSLFRVAITDAQRAGEAFIPIHWTDQNGSGGRAGILVDDKVDPISGQPGFKLNAAQIDKVSADWSAFLVAREKPVSPPDCLWWTSVRVAGGWLVELAGNGDESAIESLLPEGDRVEAIDSGRGDKRIAISSDGRLQAALFIARGGVLPSREWLIAQLEESEDGPSIRYLAARAPGARSDPGATICACFNVGMKTILTAIAGQGLTTVPEIVEALGAGTNCGSCRPALARILGEQELFIAAE